MTKMILTPCLLLFVGTCLFAQPLRETDTTAKKETPTPRKTQIKVTTRLHTRGMFLYGGRISTNNPAFDVNFTLNRPKWGFFFYKAIDLKDHTSDNNFSLLAFYKNFKLSNKLTVTPHIGIFFEQLHGLADTGSDMSVILVSAYKLSTHFTVDYTAFVGHVALETEDLDWVNRGRLLFFSKHIDLTASYWHNNHVLDDQDHMSASLAAVYKFKLSNAFNMSLGATEFAILKSSDEVDLPKTNRFLLTLALQYTR